MATGVPRRTWVWRWRKAGGGRPSSHWSAAQSSEGGFPNLPKCGPASKFPLSGDYVLESPMFTHSAHKHRSQERRETHLRHISPVSVMLGCQILVRHFTLGGCNTERKRLSKSRLLPHTHLAPHSTAYWALGRTGPNQGSILDSRHLCRSVFTLHPQVLACPYPQHDPCTSARAGGGVGLVAGPRPALTLPARAVGPTVRCRPQSNREPADATLCATLLRCG